MTLPVQCHDHGNVLRATAIGAVPNAHPGTGWQRRRVRFMWLKHAYDIVTYNVIISLRIRSRPVIQISEIKVPLNRNGDVGTSRL